MENKKYKREEFTKYFYGLHPRLNNEKILHPDLFIKVFDEFRQEYTSLHELYFELNEISKNEHKNKSKR